MGVYKIFPSQDTTIYTDYNKLNAGLDSILDLSKNAPTGYPSSSTSRVLVQFSNDDIADALSKTTGSISASLKLYNAHVESIPTNFSIEVNPIYESWDMGTGRFNNIPEIEDGASWKYRSANQTNAWEVSSLPSGVVSSWYSGNKGGANWYETYSVTQSFNYFSTKDISINVTDIVNAWSSSTIDNNGFIIHTSGSLEFDHNYQYTFNFFSRDTNTIYPPCLEFKWDDSTFTPGATPLVANENINIAIANNKNIFYDNEYVKFKVYAREKYPQRVYATSALTKYIKILPSSSYYSIIDLQTNLKVIDFDTVGTKLSADSESSYFRLYMNGLEPDRYYKIQIKSIIDGGTYIYDDDYYFKVNQTVE
jgi:hypothetical protein